MDDSEESRKPKVNTIPKGNLISCRESLKSKNPSWSSFLHGRHWWVGVLYFEKPWLGFSFRLGWKWWFLVIQIHGWVGTGPRRRKGFSCSTRLMAVLLPVGPWPADITERQCVQGACGCRNSRQHAGSCEVQHWGCLSPLGFTHPLSIKCVSPHPLFFVCVCALIIRWLLAYFPNSTLTFLSATEKLGIPSTGKQSKRPRRIPALCTNPLGHGPCPITHTHIKRRMWELHAAYKQKTIRSHVVHFQLCPFYRWGSQIPDSYSDLLAQAHSGSIRAKWCNFFKAATTRPFAV